MKHTRKRTLAASILAKLDRAKLNYSPGIFVRTKSPISRSTRRTSIRRTSRNNAPQKILEYYGIPNVLAVDEWEIPMRWEKYGYRDDDWNWVVNDTFVKRRERQRRRVKKFEKKYGLECKLINSS